MLVKCDLQNLTVPEEPSLHQLGEHVTLFEKGRLKTGGRARGAKNRLSHAFLTALAEDFEQHGVEALKIARFEKPVEYIRIVAGDAERA